MLILFKTHAENWWHSDYSLFLHPNSNESVMNRIYLWLLTALLVFSTVGVNAQTGLAGRTYYNANIMAETMNNATKDMDKKMAEARAKRVAPSSEEGTTDFKLTRTK